MEETPLSQAILHETISRSSYAALLANLATLHASLEEELCRWCEGPPVSALFHPGLCRSGCAREDLLFLGGSGSGGEQGHRAADQLLRACGGDPGALTGVVYVLEGSRLGSTILCRKIAGALGLSLTDTDGLAYHLHRRELLGEDFRALVLGLESMERSFHDRVVAGACSAFSCMKELYANPA